MDKTKENVHGEKKVSSFPESFLRNLHYFGALVIFTTSHVA